MAKVKVANITATDDTLFLLDTMGNMWYKSKGTDWNELILPDEVPV